MWKKETRSKPLVFNFDEELFSSDECPVMEESSDQIYPELNSSSTDAVDEMHPNIVPGVDGFARLPAWYDRVANVS